MRIKRFILTGIVVAAVLSLGFGLGYGVFMLREPASLAAPTQVESVPVTARAFDDARVVDVEVSASADVTVSASASGRITAIMLEVGQELTSGQALLTIDDTVVVGLATEVPMWRDLTLGDTGADVAALQRELARLGQDVTETGALDRATLAAVAEVRGEQGQPSDVILSGWAWLPGPSVELATISVALGSKVGEDSPLLSVTSTRPVAAVIPAEGAQPGPRMLVVEDAQFELDGQGRLSTPDARQLVRTDAFRAAREESLDASTITMKASWVLVTPISVYGVPPAVIAGQDGQRCVFLEGTAVPVELVSSQLGLALVTSDQELSTVDPTIPADASCP